MSSQQLDEERIFHVARGIPDEALRSEYLDQVCAGDQALRERVEALLEAHEKEQSFLKSNNSIEPTVDHSPITESPGQQIGRFKLLQKIGEGGFGVVYMAEQSRPVRRKVALKIIKPGMDTHAVVARFEAERQALAMMEHPNIARVLDGGATDAGRPYFVMELVKGVPITEYCDKNQLSTEGRLKLFTTVCQAVQHAHQKGIIHRDLKPSNVLVTLADGEPVVKVIDFGVAKATNQQLTEKTLFTQFGQMIGTPQYMSPEQAEMSCLDVDTRSDVYSLGVLLYELLTGTTPIEAATLHEAGCAEIQRLIREQETPKPSTRLSNSGDQLTVVAKHRSLSPDQLQRAVRGDLDWIVMKALEKDRSRRYETPSSLADDVEKFLQDEPVDACPPSTGYRLHKFVRRNRHLIATIAVVAITLIASTVASSWFAWRMKLAKDDAEHQKNELLDVVFDQGMLDALSGNVERALESADRLRRADDRQRSILLAGYARFTSNGVTARALKDVIEKTKAAIEEFPDNVALKALLTMCYDATGQVKAVTERGKLASLQPQTVEDRLMLARALQMDPKVGLEHLEVVMKERKSTLAQLLRGRLRANDITQSGNLDRSMEVLKDIQAASRALDLETADVARVDCFASLVQLLASHRKDQDSEFRQQILDEAAKMAKLIEDLDQPIAWDDFNLGSYYYEIDDKPNALRLHQRASERSPELGYFRCSYLALAHECGRNVPISSTPDGPFSEFARAIRLVEDGRIDEAEKTSLRMLDEGGVWASYMALNTLGLIGSDERKSKAKECLNAQRTSNSFAVHTWIYGRMIPYHAGQGGTREETLEAADSSEYPVLFRMLAQLTFGMESLGRYRASGRESDRTEAVECLRNSADNKIVYYALHKWARALAERTERPEAAQTSSKRSPSFEGQ